MITMSFNQMRDLNDYVNKNAIPKRNIVNIFQSTDGTFLLIYYDED